ncbi:MAG: hypothetical protein QW727_01650 [Candidatus Pacearchaeota archaeon]
MALELNATREPYREFYGKNVWQMPELIADGRVPMSVAGLMQRRLDVRNSDADVKSSYMDNYFDTGDAVLYHPDGRVKIVLDSQTLREMTPDTQRVGGALLLGEDVYDALQGEEFKKGKLGKVDERLTKEQAKAHPVWKVLARDQALLDDYADCIFAEGKQRFNDDNAMGVFLDSAGDKPKLRAWCVCRLGLRSDASGGDSLVSDHGRFVGIAPEALRFDSALKGLEATVRPELLEPFREFRKKL